MGTIQEILIEENNEKLQTNYIKKNCVVFDEEEENKNEYMSLFKEYQNVIEKHLENVKRLYLKKTYYKCLNKSFFEFLFRKIFKPFYFCFENLGIEETFAKL